MFGSRSVVMPVNDTTPSTSTSTTATRMVYGFLTLSLGSIGFPP